MDPALPQPPPTLNGRLFWPSLLGPMGLTAGFAALMVMLGQDRGIAIALGTGMIFVALAAAMGWVGYSLCLSDRLQGPSKMILIVAYPLLQVILISATAGLGYLVLRLTEGGY